MPFSFLNTRYYLAAILWLFISLNNPLFSQEKKDSTAVINDTSIINDSSTAQPVKPPVQDSTVLNLNKTDSISSSKPNTGILTIGKNLDSLKNVINTDSLTKKKLAKKLLPNVHGTIGMGYDYGIIPFAANTNFPLGYYKTDGNISVDALGLPVNVTYFYSSLHNIAGLNNYFRVSFDEKKYKEKLGQYNAKSLEEEKSKLTKLQQQQQALQQMLAFSEWTKKYMPSQNTLSDQLTEYKNKYNGISPPYPDSLKGLNLSAQDSIKNLTKIQANADSSIKKVNSFKSPTLYSDSISKVTNQLHQYDSVSQTINRYKKEMEDAENQIKAVKRKITMLENPEMLAQDNPYLKKTQQIMSGIKKMEVGLCYPNYSTFLMNGSTIKGLNVEWEKKYYLAFTYGKTINTVLTTNNVIQNQLQTTQNLYNFFDFNNVRDSRKIAALKFGIGKKESSHLHAGILYGTGLSSYTGNPFNTVTENNIVLELDGKYVLNSANSIDLVYGKSALYQNGFSETPETPVARTLFSGFRSNAALARYNLNLMKTKTKITCMGRLVDPFFKSYGVGFMRSDNLRYEIKIEQPLGNRVKFSGFYRRDRDNLLNSFLYTTTLQTIGSSCAVKITKRFTARLSFSPVIQQVKSKDNSYFLNNLNNISTVVLTFTPRLKKINTSFNGLYNYYKLTSAGKNTDFQSVSFNNSTMFNSVIRTNLSANWFHNSAGDSLNNGTLMCGLEIGFTGKNGFMITMGGKYAHNKITGDQFGGLLRANIPIWKHISLELQAERLVLGDFYSNFYLAQMKQFPYYGYGKVNFSF